MPLSPCHNCSLKKRVFLKTQQIIYLPNSRSKIAVKDLFFVSLFLKLNYFMLPLKNGSCFLKPVSFIFCDSFLLTTTKEDIKFFFTLLLGLGSLFFGARGGKSPVWQAEPAPPYKKRFLKGGVLCIHHFLLSALCFTIISKESSFKKMSLSSDLHFQW